jgi:hypothetical protein
MHLNIIQNSKSCDISKIVLGVCTKVYIVFCGLKSKESKVYIVSPLISHGDIHVCATLYVHHDTNKTNT